MLFTFPLRYWFTIGVCGVFSLTGWCRQFQAGFLRSRLTQDTARPTEFVPTGLSPFLVQLSRCFSLISTSKRSPITPVQHATQVWALPFSLATTGGIIIIFFSCGYLDVSVLRVGSLCRALYLQYNRLSHSETQGYIACVQLPLAYRSLPRPSSPHRP